LRTLRHTARARRRRADLLARVHLLPGLHRSARGALPELRRRARAAAAQKLVSVRHLYVHLPFCSSRCGYCDFVTVVGRRDEHGSYVDALVRELELDRDLLAPAVETVYLGGGTPTFTEAAELERLLAALPSASELTVEANPETVTPELAELLSRNRVTRVSIGAQSFHMHLLDVLDRRCRPEDVRRAVHRLRDAGIDNISVDLIYGIPR